MKHFYITFFLFSICSNGFSQSKTAVDSLLVLDQKLEQFSTYIQLNDQENLVNKIDSIYHKMFVFPEQFKKQWLQLKTNDTEKLASVLKIKSPDQKQLALLDWKYNQTNEDLELLLNYFHSITGCADKILYSDARGENVFLESDYESATAFVAKRDYQLFHDLLQKVIAEHNFLLKKEK